MPGPSRRTVLTSAAATAAALPFMSLSAFAQDDDRRVGFAIVGLGSFSMGQMLPNFANTQHAKPTALVSGSPDKQQRVAEQYGIGKQHLYSYDTFDRIADDDTVDVVYIALPTGMHAEYTIRALQAGKHVMCEKPMASSVEECRQMIEAAEQAGKKLMIAYRIQYEPINMTVVKACREGDLGSIRMVDGQAAFSQRGGTWRTDPSLNGGGGPLMDLGIYIVQAHRYTTGEEPIRVRGQTWWPEDSYFKKGAEATCTWQFEMPSGALTHGATSWDSYNVNRYRVIGTDGRSELEPATNYNGIQGQIRRGRNDVTQLPPNDYNQFAGELEHMAQCVLNDTEPKTGGQEGLHDIRAMKAIYESAETGRAVELEQA